MDIINILLVDDHEIVRAGYHRLLENAEDIKIIAEASSGEVAYRTYVKLQPDVVVMDLSMPGIGGLEAARKIRKYDHEAKILVFSVHENETFLNRTLEAGVLGYITKRSAAKVMITAVRAVAKKQQFIGQEMQSFLVKSDNNLFEQLSPREFEIFLLLAEGKSVNEIADILILSSKTVGHHYTNLKKKLKISNAAEIIRLAIGKGFIKV
ncbi:response regulator transcription factor [Candidatus Halobeggiatoa sp. HSG11]|nr:response regulator transcription factor [Candidatus Halobeggiatoa sp. HSG11]